MSSFQHMLTFIRHFIFITVAAPRKKLIDVPLVDKFSLKYERLYLLLQKKSLKPDRNFEQNRLHFFFNSHRLKRCRALIFPSPEPSVTRSTGIFQKKTEILTTVT